MVVTAEGREKPQHGAYKVPYNEKEAAARTWEVARCVTVAGRHSNGAAAIHDVPSRHMAKALWHAVLDAHEMAVVAGATPATEREPAQGEAEVAGRQETRRVHDDSKEGAATDDCFGVYHDNQSQVAGVVAGFVEKAS